MRAAALLRVLQLADSSFPTGSFAYSNGLEGLSHLGLVRTEAHILASTRALIEDGLAGVELPAVLHAHSYARDGQVERLAALDALMSALKPIDAFRSSSLKTGRRLLESAAAVIDDPVLRDYQSSVRRHAVTGHHAIAWGVVCASCGIDAESAALAFASTAVQGQTAAAVRLGLIGHAAAQHIATRLQPTVIEAVRAATDLDLDEMGGYQPLLDLAGLRQPELDTRLFAS